MSFNETDYMCPNCQTKCNGPHLEEETPYVTSGRRDRDAADSKQLSADAADGAALRRLRELCPVGELWFEVFGPHPEDGHFQVVVETVGKYDLPGIRGNGTTIAEAADKCREALA